MFSFFFNYLINIEYDTDKNLIIKKNVKEDTFFDIFAQTVEKYRLCKEVQNTTISKCQTLLEIITLFDILEFYISSSLLLLKTFSIIYSGILYKPLLTSNPAKEVRIEI